MVTVFWDREGIILIDFMDPGTSINSDTYIATLRKLKEAIRRKRPKKDMNTIQLHHDNARPHTSFATTQAIAQMGWSTLPHPPYSPDLAPSDFHMFGVMKADIRGQEFESLDDLKSHLKRWAARCSAEFCQAGFDAWVCRWRKCIEMNGDFVEV